MFKIRVNNQAIPFLNNNGIILFRKFDTKILIRCIPAKNLFPVVLGTWYQVNQPGNQQPATYNNLQNSDKVTEFLFFS
jgi:hypothetical protein